MHQIETNIVVIGGGTTGLAAALTALQKGVKGVIVLEKRINYGGNSSMAGGFVFGAESRLQKKAAGKIISREDAFQEALMFAHFDRINPKLIRALINKSGETIDWMEDQGIEFELLLPMNAHKIKGKFTEQISKESTGIIMQYSLAMDILAEKIKERGGQILLRTAARKILCDNNGVISGVVAVTRTGEEIQIKCKSVVLSPGGFTGNKALLKKYFDYDEFATEALPLMGDGIKMAEEAGAYLEDYATICHLGAFPRYVKLETMKNKPNTHLVMGPYTVWINAKGERFIDPGMPGGGMGGGHPLLRQPGKTGYAMLDDKLLQMPWDLREMAMSYGPNVTDAKTLEELLKLRKDLQAEARNGVDVCVSDSWDDIARYIGADPRVLKATMDEYNSFCDRGFDETFNKAKKFMVPLRTPPYYAVKLCGYIVEAIGPVRINERTEVLDKQEDPIPGFYAAGTITSGWCGHEYHPGGGNLGFGTTAGRIAGENAAKYTGKK